MNVNADSVEYHTVSDLFYKSMKKLNAVIVRIQQLRNPILEKFYSMYVFLIS